MRDSLRWGPDKSDVVIIGASYSGLITATLLQQAGLKTIVVDELDEVGQPGGSYPYNDYWINYGHRDGIGLRQTTFQGTLYNFEAMKRTGVTLKLAGPLDPGMLTHNPPGKITSMYGSDPDELRRMARDTMRLSEEDIGPFLETVDRLRKTPRDEAERLVPVTMAEWLPKSGLSAAVQKAMLVYCTCIWSVPAETTSVGRLIISHFQTPQQHYHAADPDAPHLQGLIYPYANAFKESGGEIWLDHKVSRILHEDGRAIGVRVRNSNGFVREVHAKAVVFAYTAYKLFELIDENLFPADYVAQLKSFRKYETPLLTVWIGLSDRPRRRSDGAPDEMSVFHRLLFPGGAYGGGWKIVSNAHEGSGTPPGKHLLAIYYGNGEPLHDSAEKIQKTIDHVWDYYDNLDDIVEWHKFQWIEESHSMAWVYKTDPRPSQQTPIPGLYLTGFSSDVEGIDFDADACGAMRAADKILKAFGMD